MQQAGCWRKHPQDYFNMNISFIYMASGYGSRFGSNKLCAMLDGRPLYRHGLECLLAAAGELREKDGFDVRLILVSQYRDILEDGNGLGLETVYNGSSSQGITASLRLGTEAAGEDADILLFFVADQPYMKGSTVASFVRGFAGCGSGIGCVESGGRRGNPAAFSRRYRKELLALMGDRGGSVIMKAHPEDVWTMEVPEGELKDIDVQEDLER